jgi:xanthine dehydrogenase accessory factor
VGGGCIEAEVWAEAREALRANRSALHHFSLTADEASEEGMVCGGTMDIFIDVIGVKSEQQTADSNQQELLEALTEN